MWKFAREQNTTTVQKSSGIDSGKNVWRMEKPTTFEVFHSNIPLLIVRSDVVVRAIISKPELTDGHLLGANGKLIILGKYFINKNQVSI